MSLCCSLRAPKITADLRLLDSKIPRPKKLLFLARYSPHSADRRSRRGRGLPSRYQTQRPESPGGWPCSGFKDLKEQCARLFATLGRAWNLATLPGTGSVTSGPSPSPNCLCNAGRSTAPGESLASVDPGHGMETARSVAAPEETSPRRASVSPSEAVRPAAWTLLFVVGRWLGSCCISLLFVQTTLGFFTRPLPGLQVRALREPLFGVRGLPTKSLDWGGAVQLWLARTQHGKDRGPAPGGYCWTAAWVRPLLCAPVLRAGAGRVASRVSECLFPAFGLTAFDPWRRGTFPRPPVSVGRDWGGRRPGLWTEACTGLVSDPRPVPQMLTSGLRLAHTQLLRTLPAPPF